MKEREKVLNYYLQVAKGIEDIFEHEGLSYIECLFVNCIVHADILGNVFRESFKDREFENGRHTT